MANNWKKFVEISKNRKPVSFLIEAAEKSQKGFALDLGCGAGVDARYLAESGFKVEAVDSSKDSVMQAKKTCKGLNVKVIEKNIADFEIKKNKYSLIISWNLLPFLDKKQAKKTLVNVKEGLLKNGLFVFSIFGPDDKWAEKHEKMSFFTFKEMEKILSGMKFIKTLEKRETKPEIAGEMKFWHLIQGLAEK